MSSISSEYGSLKDRVNAMHGLELEGENMEPDVFPRLAAFTHGERDTGWYFMGLLIHKQLFLTFTISGGLFTVFEIYLMSTTTGYSSFF